VAPAPAPADPVSADAPTEPPRESDQQGLASWYGPGLHGRRTASGERFDRYELTAAHRTLPFGSRVCVRSSVTGKTVVVRINDRGPFTGGRVIDLSQGAAQELGMAGLGIKPVELWLLNKDEEACPDALLDASALTDADSDDDPAPRAAARKAPGKASVVKSQGAAKTTTHARSGNARR
jgi:rare lipoprotein A